MMRCPYCAEDINNDAIVCKHCHRELFVVKPLLDKIEELNAKLAGQAATQVREAGESAGFAARVPAQPHASGLSGLEAIALTYIALVAAHLVIVVHYDLKLIYLKFVSIAVPFVFGLWRRVPDRWALSSALVLGFIVAMAANATMLAIVAEVDKVSFLPKDAYEWRELAYYEASIAFGFLTGVIVRHLLMAIYVPNAKPNRMIDWVAHFIVEQFGEGRRKFTLRAIRSMVASILGFVSAIISILTGLWEYLK